MKRSSKKKHQDFIAMPRTRAMLSEIWEHWRTTLGQTPDAAKKLMTAAIKEMHKAEIATLKKAMPKKRAIKKKVKALAKKAKSTKKKAIKS